MGIFHGRLLVKSRGLTLVVFRKPSHVQSGTILVQRPAGGSLVKEGTAVKLYVAKPFPSVPNVVGQTLDAARMALPSYKISIVHQVSWAPKDTVIAVDPAPGSELAYGRTVTLTLAKPAPVQPVVSQSPSNCTPGYSPCLPPASDYDCAGGSGNGPAYTGPVRVTGSDPYGLDADGDGYGCE